MWSNLESELVLESEKLIRRQERYAVRLAEDYGRRVRRSTGPISKSTVYRPAYWDFDRGFDPYRVRARAAVIAHSLSRKFKTGAYEPFAAAGYTVPKDDGAGVRDVSVYQIADSTVSLLLYRGLMAKNLPKLSQRSYAYRGDRSGVDALMYLREEFKGRQRIYVAEYDFRKFFDTINHDYILRTLVDGGYLMTGLEKQLIERFLRSRLPSAPYDSRSDGRRDVGLAQGTSVSLFLANVAASPIDRQLERIGVGFVRYADDTVLFDADYGRISRAVEALHDLSIAMGVDINQSKSNGIRLLVEEESAAEFASTPSIEYLGHRVSSSSIAFKDHVLDRVKRHVVQLIFENLLREPLRGTQDKSRLTTTDRDYATLVWQLRRYFYGSLSEREVRRFAAGRVPRRRFIGLMSYFPLLDDHTQLKEFDDWLTTQLWLALRKRRGLLGAVAVGAAPHHVARHDLRDLITTSGTTGRRVDLRLPSLSLMATVVSRAVLLYGSSVVSRNAADEYNYD